MNENVRQFVMTATDKIVQVLFTLFRRADTIVAFVSFAVLSSKSFLKVERDVKIEAKKSNLQL